MVTKTRTRSRADTSMLTSTQSGVPFGLVGRPQTGTSERFLDVQWRQKRQHNRAEASRLKNGHRESFAESLDVHVRDVLKQSLGDALEELAETWGVAWADVARMVGVSVPALRKWRTSGNASGENVRRVAEVVAFLRILREVGIAEPASWISVPCVRGYTVTPRHLYTPESSAVLIDMASSSIDPVTVLDELSPLWKDTYSSDFEVVTAEDGEVAIVSKSRAHG